MTNDEKYMRSTLEKSKNHEISVAPRLCDLDLSLVTSVVKTRFFWNILRVPGMTNIKNQMNDKDKLQRIKAK